MKTITFATGNRGKLLEARALMPGVEVLSQNVEFKEPRDNDLMVIAREKLRQAKEIISGPCFVQDSGFYIEALNGFPGSFVNFALATIGVEGILKLMDGEQNRKCAFRQCLAYFDGKDDYYFTAENPGRLSTVYAGKDSRQQWSALWHIYIPDGADVTLSEFTQEQLDARRLNGSGTIRQLARFLKVEE